MTPDELRALVDAVARDPSAWSARVRHDGARHFERLRRDAVVEVLLICWSGEDHDTGLHDHDVSNGAFAVARGELVEDRLLADGRTLRRRLRAGASVGLTPDHVHRVQGVDGAPAVSIHAYSPPLRRLGVYVESPGGGLARETVPADHELRPAASTAGAR